MEKIKRFMVVTESGEHAGFFKAMLWEKQIGDVTIVNDPREALSVIEAKRVQFVIIEREMKKLSGQIVLQKVHAARQFTHLPCLLFSTRLSDEVVRLAKELGKDVLKVPLVRESVWPAIAEICRREESIDDLELELRKVEGFLVERQYPVAQELLDQALRAREPTARALALSAEIAFHLADYALAERMAQNALSFKQAYYPAMQLLAKVYSKTDRHRKSIDLLMSMVDASPSNLTSLLTLSEAYTEANQVAKAKEILHRVRGLDPGNKHAAFELGKIAFREGDVETAEQFLAQADDAAELGRFFNNLAVGLVGKGDLDRAVRTYEAAMHILKEREFESMVYLQYNLGLAMKKKGCFELAFAILGSCCIAQPSYKRAFQSFYGTMQIMSKQGLPFDREFAQRIIKAHQEAAVEKAAKEQLLTRQA